jgi:chromosome partitioning protein
MKSLCVLNNKGGVGKTTVAVNLALHFQRDGIATALFDADAQANASLTLRRFASGVMASDVFLNSKTARWPNPRENSLALIGADNRLVDVDAGGVKLSDAVKRMTGAMTSMEKEGWDAFLVDASANPGIRLFSILHCVGHVLAPIELEAYAIHGIKQLVTIIAKARTANPKLKFIGMLPNKVDRRNPRHIDHLSELRTAYPDMVLSAELGLRGAFAESLTSEEPIWKNRKSAARPAIKEIKRLADFMALKMGLAGTGEKKGSQHG